MKLTRTGDSREYDAEVVSRDGNTIRVRIGDRELAAEFTPNTDGGGILAIDRRRYPIFAARRKNSILVSVGPASFEFKPAEAAAPRARARSSGNHGADARQGAQGAGARRRPGRSRAAAGRARSDEDGNDAR